MKKILTFLLLVLISLSLSGCIAKEDGTVITYSELTLPDGIFIRRNEKTFIPLFELDSTNKEFQWFSGKDDKIPHLQPEDSLIIYSNKSVPDSLTLYSMQDFGYSLGIKFSDDKNGNFAFPSNQQDYCPDGTSYDYIKQNVSDFKNTRLVEINGVPFTSQLLSSLGFVKGLDKDAAYKISLYQGTVYKTLKFKSATHILLLKNTYTLSNYKELKDKYFIINLPSNLTSGYWILDGYGMFYLDENVHLGGDPIQSDEELEEIQKQEAQEQAKLEFQLNQAEYVDASENDESLDDQQNNSLPAQASEIEE